MGFLKDSADKMKIWAMKKGIEMRFNCTLPFSASDVLWLDKYLEQKSLEGFAHFELLSGIYLNMYGEERYRKTLQEAKVKWEAENKKLGTVVNNLLESAAIILEKAKEERDSKKALPPAGQLPGQ